MEFIKNGSALIQAMIDKACEDGVRAATVSGMYEIDTAIRIPSDFTLTLANCHLRMADDVYSNMFVNAHHGTDIGRTPEGTDRNIIVQGLGRVILDGGKYNGLSERNSLKDGLPHISKNNMLLFTNVDGFTIRNLHFRNQRWWALNFLSCCNGRISDIDFLACDLWQDDDGVIRQRLGQYDKGFKWHHICVRNGDGIDIRSGCHDIIIENITGFTEDDTVALTCLPGSTEKMYCIEGQPREIYNITVRNVMSSAFCANVRLLAQSGTKVYNILVDGIMDTSKDSPHMTRGCAAVFVGADQLYCQTPESRQPTPDEFYNLTVRNVCSRAQFGIFLVGSMKDCLFENIRGFDGCKVIEDRADVDVIPFIRN